jgi:cytochrome c553
VNGSRLDLSILLPLLPLLAVACRPASPPPMTSPVQGRMFEHFALARDLRVFAANGDLARLRVTATELAGLEETWGMPPGADAYLQRVHAAARRAAAAGSVPEAATAVAEVARACGDCHLTNDATLGERFQVAAPRVDDPAVRHTNYLSWVSRLLWDGLVGPSERMWRTGAEALSGAEGLPPPRARSVPAGDIDRAGATLHELGTRALAEDDPQERIRLLAAIWTTCADCHTQAEVRQAP